MSVRVLIADDNPIVRMGLSSLLELDDDTEVCAEAATGTDALRLAHEQRPDVVLLDVRMPHGGGLDVVGELSGLARVLMLTHSDEPAVVSQALSGGATGYLVHGTFESAELVQAIHDTAQGRARLSPPAAAVLVRQLGRAGGPGIPEQADERRTPAAGPPSLSPELARRLGLSRRELDICTLLVRGASNAEIASELFIEEKTVKNHNNRIFAKLGATSRSQAIAICLGTHSPV